MKTYGLTISASTLLTTIDNVSADSMLLKIYLILLHITFIKNRKDCIYITCPFPSLFLFSYFLFYVSEYVFLQQKYIIS